MAHHHSVLKPPPPHLLPHSTAIAPRTYEAHWNAERGNTGLPTPTPSSGRCHLQCLRAHVCAAVRAALRPEDLVSLCFRVDVESVLSSEAGTANDNTPGGGSAEERGFESFVKGSLARALTQEPPPWWVCGQPSIKPTMRRSMHFVDPVPDVTMKTPEARRQRSLAGPSRQSMALDCVWVLDVGRLGRGAGVGGWYCKTRAA